MGYVQQFHDEAGDAVDRTTWTDLTLESDPQPARTRVARIAVVIASSAAIAVGAIGVTVLPWSRADYLLPATSPLVIPSMILVVAGVLFLMLSLGGLWRVANELDLRHFARRVQSDPNPVVHPGVPRSHA